MRRTHKIFPDVDKRTIDNTMIELSCWVRVKLYGKWYEVYHMNVIPTNAESDGLLRFIKECYKAFHLYTVHSEDDLVNRLNNDQIKVANLNIEEKERMLVIAYINTNQTHKI